MKSQRTPKTFIITSLILLVGGTIAFAHGGWGHGGYGPHMRGYGGYMSGPGYGDGPMMGYGPGRGKSFGYGNLSEEEAAELEETRERFFNETKELRQKIHDMEIALQDEMAKDKPDSDKLSKIQKEISKYRTEFDQKAIAHRLEMRKLMPEGFRGRGYGRGGGYCWR